MDRVKKTRRRVVMISPGGRGGIQSVIQGYIADEVFSRWNVTLLNSHDELGLVLRQIIAVKAFLCLIGLLIRRKVGLVHCHAAMKKSFWRKSLFALTAKLFRAPVIFHLHGSEMKIFVEEQPRCLKRLIGWILSQSSVVVVLSDIWARYIQSISPGANVKIIPNYVDLPDAYGKITRESQPELLEVLFLGAVGRRKGIYDLLPAFKNALTEFPSLRLIIGGNGEVERARALAVELKIEGRVQFAGWVGGEAKVDLLRRAHIFVLPSYNEGLPVSLLEAMSWRIPVISTRVGGIPDLVRHGIDGFLVGAGDRIALSSAMIELAKKAELRERMGMEGRFRVERNFCKSAVLPKLEDVYRSFLQPDLTDK